MAPDWPGFVQRAAGRPSAIPAFGKPAHLATLLAGDHLASQLDGPSRDQQLGGAADFLIGAHGDPRHIVEAVFKGFHNLQVFSR